MSRELYAARYEMIKVMILQNRMDKAKEETDKLIEDVKDIVPYRDLHYNALKMALELNAEDEGKRKNLTAIISDAFGSTKEYGAKVLYDLAQFNKACGDQVRYVEKLKQLYELFEVYEYGVDVLFELAGAYQSIESDPKKAIAIYTKFLNEAPTDAPNRDLAAVNMASCYTALGQTEKASTILKEALDIDWG